MEILLNNRVLELSTLPVLGSGGEGLVVRLPRTKTVLKVYHQPTKARSDKLAFLLSQDWTALKDTVAWPIEPVFKKKPGLSVGFTMPYFGKGVQPVGVLANKKARLNLGITNRHVTRLFLNGMETVKRIHPLRLIGDFSDQNTLFGTALNGDLEMLFIDVDSWQTGRFPCPVGTEEYIDPVLYGQDLSNRPLFTEDNDWYSFAVLLFRSLLFVHPYGGVHNKFKALTARAEHKISVFDKDVIYPKIALHPDVVSDALLHAFHRIFTKGERFALSEKLLKDFGDSLVDCSGCGTLYPKERTDCPMCSAKNITFIQKPVVVAKGVKATQLFSTDGYIAYCDVLGDEVRVIVHDKGSATMHLVRANRTGKVLPLFIQPADAKYKLTDTLLAVNAGSEEKLDIYEIGSNGVKSLKTTVTEILALNGRAAFSSTKNRLLRIINGSILAIEKGGLDILERRLRAGIPEQTWFVANGEHPGYQLFGFDQILTEQRYWYFLDGMTFEPKIPALEIGESLIDISVKFSSGSILLRRKTQLHGADYLRVEIVDNDGKLIHSTRDLLQDVPVSTMHGQTYSGGVLLHATDAGIVQEKVSDRTFKTFDQTAPFVADGNTLLKFGKGVLVVSENTVTLLELT